MGDKTEPQRPYYKNQKPKPAIVIPVVDWTIAQVMFWKKDGEKKDGEKK